MNQEVYLMLTEFCPNRCDYCYIKNRSVRETMTMNTVDKIIQEYDPWRIILFGGEPLVEYELMEQILAKYHGTRRFQLVTSANVNYERFITDLNKRYPLDEIQVSWDGVGNNSRLSADGSNKQDQVFDKILWTASHGVNIDVKCVLNNLNIGGMYETTKVFWEYGLNGEFVIAHRENFTEDFFTEFERQLPLCLDVNKRLPMEFLNKILQVIQKDFMVSSCDAGGYLVFRPNGDRHYCTILSQYGNYTMEDLMERCKHKDCQDCKLYFMCDGGCRYERVALYGDKWRDNYCTHTCRINNIYYRVITNWLKGMSREDRLKLNDILKRYLNFKNVYWGIGN